MREKHESPESNSIAFGRCGAGYLIQRVAHTASRGTSTTTTTTTKEFRTMEHVILVADQAHMIHHAFGFHGFAEYVRHHVIPALRSRRSH